jgi:hypothetical protein
MIRTLIRNLRVSVLCSFLAFSSNVLSGSGKIFITKAFIASPDGTVHLVDSAGKQINFPKEKGQVSCERPIVAEDKQTVGWLIDYENCCTSYPIRLTLVIFRSGEIIQRVKPGLMIFDWCFLDEGRKIALSSGTVHGMTYRHLNLYNARTGRLLKSWDGGFDDVAPAWARGLSQ